MEKNPKLKLTLETKNYFDGIKTTSIQIFEHFWFVSKICEGNIVYR